MNHLFPKFLPLIFISLGIFGSSCIATKKTSAKKAKEGAMSADEKAQAFRKFEDATSEIGGAESFSTVGQLRMMRLEEHFVGDMSPDKVNSKMSRYQNKAFGDTKNIGEKKFRSKIADTFDFREDGKPARLGKENFATEQINGNAWMNSARKFRSEDEVFSTAGWKARDDEYHHVSDFVQARKSFATGSSSEDRMGVKKPKILAEEVKEVMDSAYGVSTPQVNVRKSSSRGSQVDQNQSAE